MKTSILLLLLSLLSIQYMSAQDRNLKKFKPKKNMVELDVLRGETTLKVGQKAYYQYPVHGSVGVGGKMEIGDEAIVKVAYTHTAYEHKHTAGQTGDDSATDTIVLDALAEGQTDIIVRKIFRGSIKEEHTIKITVK